MKWAERLPFERERNSVKELQYKAIKYYGKIKCSILEMKN